MSVAVVVVYIGKCDDHSRYQFSGKEINIVSMAVVVVYIHKRNNFYRSQYQFLKQKINVDIGSFNDI